VATAGVLQDFKGGPILDWLKRELVKKKSCGKERRKLRLEEQKKKKGGDAGKNHE